MMPRIRLSCIPRIFLYLFLVFPVSAFAQPNDDKNFLLMYFKEEELVVESATRGRKALNHTAENITVVTADDIRLMNAHTVADVLNTVTGVQVFQTGGPGSMATAYIQGSEQKHVTVMIDGVVLNNLSDNVTELGMIPAQMIEKIEIVKGPASSAWGSALGGVVNIITKSGGREEGHGGLLSVSYGTHGTEDLRGEVRGRQDKFSYYLTTGQLKSDGFAENMDGSSRNAYAKLNYDLSDRTGINLSLGYSDGTRGDGQFADYDMVSDDTFKVIHSALSVNTAISKSLDLNVSLRTLRQELVLGTDQLSTGLLLVEDKYRDRDDGASAKLTWRGPYQTFVLGTDYDSKTLESNTIAEDQLIRKWALFLNDTIVFDKVAITPGVRYERTNTNGDVTSPSLGITYSFSKTILRAYTARGFNIPPISYTYGNTTFYTPNPDLKVEKVQSYQVGAETTALKYVWLKLSAFRNEIRDAIAFVPGPGFTVMAVNSERQRRQGIEIELRTTPVFNTSVTAGAEFIQATDLSTGNKLNEIPTRVYDVGIHYNDERSFKALIQGRYVDWNSTESDQGKYDSFIVDLHAAKTLFKGKVSALEAFVSVHNMFNGDQYMMALYKNPGRWYEGGVRYSF